MMFILLRQTSLKRLIQIPSFITATSHFSSTLDEPTASYYDNLISTAATSNDFPTVRRLLNKRYKDGLFNTRNTFKFVTDSYLNTDLNNLIQTLTNLDKGFTRKNAFDCLINHLCKSQKIDESLCVINAMIEKEIPVNAVTFHSLLSVLGKKNLDSAWRIITMMTENKIEIDITAYNYILSAYCYKGDLIAAASVLDMIMDKGVKVNNRTYDVLVMGACRVGKVEAALMLLRKMEVEKLSPLYSTHVHVIKSLIGLSCFKQAVEFVKVFAGRDTNLDRSNYGTLLSILVMKKRVKEAKLVFEEMVKGDLDVGDKLRSAYMILASKVNEN